MVDGAERVSCSNSIDDNAGLLQQQRASQAALTPWLRLKQELNDQDKILKEVCCFSHFHYESVFEF